MGTPSQPPRLLLALLALVALLATACGSASTVTSSAVAGERALPAVEEIAEPGALLEAPAAAASGGHQYGSTLEEWALVEGQQPSEADDRQDPESAALSPVVQWEDLIPTGASGAELMARFEEEIASVEPGSPEADQLYEAIQAEFDPAAVNTELDGQKLRLAGFVAPLTYEDDIVTEFLLVPTFGACIHVPPPPPNQTIMVSVDKENGLTLKESWGAVWVEGTMILEAGTSDLGETSYRIVDATTGEYTGI